MELTTMMIKRFAIDMVYYVLWVIEIVLLLRFIAQILGANPENEMIAFLYALSLTLMGPFANIFKSVSLQGAVIDASVVVAMAAYAVLAYLIVSLMELIWKSYAVHHVN